MSSIQLRPYQQDCAQAIRENFRSGLRLVLLTAPTGAGKTVVFPYLTAEIHENTFYSRVYIFSNRTELITQSGGTLAKFNLRFEPITADNKRINPRAWCFVAMVRTFLNRVEKQPWLQARYDRMVEVSSHEEAQRTYKKPTATKDVKVYTGASGKLYVKEIADTVIIDEAHYGDYRLLFEAWRHEKVDADTGEVLRGPFVIGCTATPKSSRANDPLSNYYQALVDKVQIKDLIDQGFLSPCVTYSAKIDRSKLRLDKKGDYSDQSQMDTFATRSVYNGLMQRYQEVCDRYNQGLPMRTICFNVNLEHSLQVTAQFNEHNIPAKHVDGTTPLHEREMILSGFKSGAFPVVCNVGILNAGFDDPGTCCIIMNRATTSTSLWLQSAGRGSRIHPGKTQFVLLDMGDNWTELGLWDAERDWSSIWNQTKKKSDKEGVAPVKQCDSCGALVHLSVKECTECGVPFPVKAKKPAEADEFTEIKAEDVPVTLSLAEITELRKVDRASLWGTLPVVTLEKLREYRGRNKEWCVHVIREASKTDDEFREKLRELARMRGYKPGWVERKEFKAQLIYA